MTARESTPEEAAMGTVLRMLACSPNLPRPFFNIARGLLLLDKPDLATTAAATATAAAGTAAADAAQHEQQHSAQQPRWDVPRGRKLWKNA
ncbi:unnamed protein product, partial [Laminaria digitata]